MILTGRNTLLLELSQTFFLLYVYVLGYTQNQQKLKTVQVCDTANSESLKLRLSMKVR